MNTQDNPLFAKLPENFFSLLAGPLKETHAGLLFVLYEQWKATIYTLPRETVIDLFCEYLESAGEEAWEADEEEGAEMPVSPRDRAHHFLRRFVKAGWVIQEQDYDYTFKLSLPDYTQAILEVLDRIRAGYRMEFRGRVFSIYQNLNSADGVSYIALQQAQELTHELIDGLKGLSHSIKVYTERLLEIDDIPSILNQIFEEYQREILGEQYYRLKTSDHVSRYRTGILKQVRSWQHNRAGIVEEAKAMAADRLASTPIEAENRLYDWLEYIETAFTGMDELIAEIDRRNAQYIRAASERLRFRLHQGRGVEQNLSTALSYLAKRALEDGEKGQTPDTVLSRVNLFPQSAVNELSLKKPQKARRAHKPAALPLSAVPGEVRQRRLERFGRRLREELSVEEINRFVARCLGSSQRLPLAEFPLEDKDDWVRMIYVVLYSRSKRAAYRLEGPKGQTVVVGGGRMSVPEKELRRKGKTDELG